MQHQFYKEGREFRSADIVKQGCTESMACNAGAIGGGVVVAAVNDSLDEDEVVDKIKYTICGILASPLFDKKSIQQRPLKVHL